MTCKIAATLLLLMTVDVQAFARTNAGCTCTDKCGPTFFSSTPWCHVNLSQCSSSGGKDWSYCDKPVVEIVPLMCGRCVNAITKAGDTQQFSFCCLNDALTSCVNESPQSTSTPLYCPYSRYAASLTGCTVPVSMATITTITIPMGSPAALPASTFMEVSSSYTGRFRTCSTDQRMDIQSVKVIDTHGIPLSLTVLYSSATTSESIAPAKVDLGSGTCAFSLASPDTSLSTALAAENPGRTIASVVVTCSSLQDCDLQYEIVVACVAKAVSIPEPTPAPAPTPPPTSAPTSAPTLAPTTVAPDTVTPVIQAFARTNAGCTCTDKCGPTTFSSTPWCHVNPSQCSPSGGKDWGYCDDPDVTVVPLVCSTCANAIVTEGDTTKMTICCLNNALLACVNERPQASSAALYCPSSRIAVTTTGCKVPVPMTITKLITVPKDTVLDVPSSSFMEMSSSYIGNVRACGTGWRIDLQSVKVIETHGAPFALAVGYVDPGTEHSLVSSGLTLQPASCGYSLTSASSSLTLSHAMKYPGFTEAAVVVYCSSAQVCNLQYEVIATCVAMPSTTTSPSATTVTAKPTTWAPITTAPIPTTRAPIVITISIAPRSPTPKTVAPSTRTPNSSTAAPKESRAGKSFTAVDYFAQGMTVLASLAAVAIAMRLRDQHNAHLEQDMMHSW